MRGEVGRMLFCMIQEKLKKEDSKMVVILLLLVAISFAQEFPSPRGYVNDFANVIDSASEVQIESLCAQIENETTVEIAVVTVDTVEPTYIEDYGVKLFEKWKIGKKGEDNGLLILASMKEREIRIEVGYGLEEYITDGEAGEIIDRVIVPRFKEGKYGKGLYDAVVKVREILKNEGYRPKKPPTKNQIDPVFCFVGFIILAIFVHLIRRGRKGTGGGGWRIGGHRGGRSSRGFGGGRSGGGGARGRW